jgi:Uma2 family endonuclease
MIDAGVFQHDERCELLEGWVVRKMVHNPAHDAVVWLVQTMLLSRLPAEWVVRVQSAIETADSRPEPDVAVVRGPGIRYVAAHPKPRDVRLVVEVADSSLAQDRDDKQRIYARARIPCYWIVNLIDWQIEVYTDPRAGRSPAYRQRREFRHGEKVPLVVAEAELAEIPVHELLP